MRRPFRARSVFSDIPLVAHEGKLWGDFCVYNVWFMIWHSHRIFVMLSVVCYLFVFYYVLGPMDTFDVLDLKLDRCITDVPLHFFLSSYLWPANGPLLLWPPFSGSVARHHWLWLFLQWLDFYWFSRYQSSGHHWCPPYQFPCLAFVLLVSPLNTSTPGGRTMRPQNLKAASIRHLVWEIYNCLRTRLKHLHR